MAKDSQPQPKPSASRGKPKSERHSARTRENKRRAEETRQRRFRAADARRTKRSYTDPDTGKTSYQGRKHYASMQRRAEQAARLAKKRLQQLNFSRLMPSQKREHRWAGRQFKTPSDLAR